MTIIKLLISMYITLFGTIIAGIINSVWCKSKKFAKLQVPMDGGKNFIDGKRIFGDNKTWKGFLGYILFNIICVILCGLFYKLVGIEEYNMFYIGVPNTILNNMLIGLLLGFAYGLFELPNSFLKRRLGIVPGKTINGFAKAFFVFFDQADSVFGCALVVCLFSSMSVGVYLAYVVVGAATHIIINMLLYCFGLRKNMF